MTIKIKEIRFRHMLCFQDNWRILSKKVGQLVGRSELKLILIAEELPLVMDVVGLQIKYSDIVAFDENFNLYFIELKKSISKSKAAKVEDQVLEYIELFDRIRSYMASKNPLYYPHLIIKRLFEIVSLSPSETKNLHPIILAIEPVEKNDFSKNIAVDFFNTEEIDQIQRNFINGKKALFLKRYNRFKMDVPTFFQTLEQNSNNLSKFEYPVVVNKIVKNQSVSCNFVYESIFDLVKHEKELSTLDSVTLEKIKDLPEIYEEFPLKSNFFIDNELKHRFNLKDLAFPQMLLKNNANQKKKRYTIQIFRSGRSFPIIYFEILPNIFLPCNQIKPVIFELDSCVNDSIAFDAVTNINPISQSAVFYENVILLDQGTYQTKLLQDHGVEYLEITLEGANYSLKFYLLSPFLKKESLLPYMTNEKVIAHLKTKVNENESIWQEEKWIITPILKNA